MFVVLRHAQKCFGQKETSYPTDIHKNKYQNCRACTGVNQLNCVIDDYISAIHVRKTKHLYLEKCYALCLHHLGGFLERKKCQNIGEKTNVLAVSNI